MTLSNAVTGEEDIIQTYLAPLAAGMAGAFGLKDDCATAAPSPGYEFVLKTDAIASGVHFLPEDHPSDIGWKALAVNVSDLAAKGARPYGYLLSLSFPQAPTRDWMSEFARGLGEAQTAFGIGLLGGDTDRRPGPISITPAVFGEVPVGCLVRRGTAHPDDIVCVSGTLGDAGLGLALRQTPERARAWNLTPQQSDHLITRYVRPLPRMALASVIRAHARASMDVSDGLLKDLGRMARASGVAAEIDFQRLPLSDAFRAVQMVDTDATRKALFAGDDYEILCAIPPHHIEATLKAAAQAHVALTPVGSFKEGAGITLRDANGTLMPLAPSGWDHF